MECWDLDVLDEVEPVLAESAREWSRELSGFCATLECFLRMLRPGFDPGSRVEAEEPEEPPLDADRAELEPVEPHDSP